MRLCNVKCNCLKIGSVSRCISVELLSISTRHRSGTRSFPSAPLWISPWLAQPGTRPKGDRFIQSLLVTSRFFPIGFHWSRPHFFGWTLTMAWLVIVGFLTSVPVYSDDHQSWLLPSGNQTANGHPPFIDDFPITTSLYRCHIWLPDGALGSWLPWRNPLRRKGRDTGWEWLGTTKDGIIMGLWCDYMIICDCYMGKSGLMIWDYNELHKIR